jgi:hypothetical protein
MDEIAGDPEAAALAEQFIAATAAQLGVDPSQINVNGFQLPATCQSTGGGNAILDNGVTMQVDPDFVAGLSDALPTSALDDCFLSMDEISADPEAAALAAAFAAATAEQMGVDPSQITVQGFKVPCASGVDDNTVTFQLAPEYLAALIDALPASALDDCFLSSEEIAADPDAAAFATQFIAATAAQLGVDPSQINVNGFSTDNDSTPGCSGSSGATGLTIHISDEFAATLGSSAAFADCWLTTDEINTDPEAAAFVASFVAATAVQLGVDPAAIQIAGISTDGDSTPGCGSSGQQMTLNMDPAYIASLGTPEQLADCYLSMAEIQSDPEALALATQFIAATAAQLGLDPSTIKIAGFSTDGDNEPGCNNEPDIGAGITMMVDPSYALAMGSDAAFADCWLSNDEIQSDPEAAAFAASFIVATAAQIGVDPSAIVLNGISTDGDTTPGCGSSTDGGVTITVGTEFVASMGDGAAFADCYLTMEEIASDPEAAAFAAAFIASTAESLGISPSKVVLNGISTDGDDEPGCAAVAGTPQQGLLLTVGSDFAASFGDDAAFQDCWLSTEEIASDPQAAAFAFAFIAQSAASIGVDPAEIVLTGISTSGNSGPGCGATTGSTSQSSLTVAGDFASTLGSTEALQDCHLSPDEIAADAEATALQEAFIAAQAAALGVSVDDISITSINTINDRCTTTDGVATSATLAVESTFVATMGDEDAFADCWLSPSEIANNPTAAQFAQALAAAQAASLGINPDQIQLNGISTENDMTPGCQADGLTGDQVIDAGGRRRMQLGSVSVHLHPGITAAPDVAAFRAGLTERGVPVSGVTFQPSWQASLDGGLPPLSLSNLLYMENPYSYKTCQ